MRFNKDFPDDPNTKFYPSLSMNKEEWIINLQRIIRYRTKLNDTKYKQFNLKQIEINIEKRMSYISTEESKFLDSVLNRHTSPIIIDRLKVEDDDGFCTLLLDPDDIKNQAAASYQHQFRKRTHKLDTMDDFWKRIYSPVDTQNDTYHPLNSDISEQDWHDTLQLLNMKSVPGTSGVPYELFTHLPLSFVNHILRIYNYVLQQGIIPTAWKHSTIIPIPKPNNFNYIMENVRPIALLDTFRKFFTRILTSRMNTIFTQHPDILCQENYCGLPGDSTATPINLLNSLIEDARTHKKELWIALQDISKAFDSINMHGLELALKRINLPTNIITLLINIFQDRELQILTHFGTTTSFKADDGIDQGDSISPLMWRIYYDPLIKAITEDRNRGYRMNCLWPTDTTDLTTWTDYHINVSTSVYMDDTAWLDSSKDRLQSTLDIAARFYDLLDIKINHKKCELIVINPSIHHSLCNVTLDINRNTWISINLHESRYLGVWLSHKKPKQWNKDRIIKIRDSILHSMKSKRISIAHAIYIINKVMYPRIAYISQSLILTKSEWDAIERPVLGFIKKIASLSASYPTSALHHEGILDLYNLWQYIVTNHLTNFFKRINSNTMDGHAALIRLRQGQIRMRLPGSIFDTSSKYMPLYMAESKSNFEVYCLTLAAQLNINIEMDNINKLDFTITGSGSPILDLWMAHF